MTSLIRIVCLFALLSCIAAVKIRVGIYCLTYAPKSKLAGQTPFLGAGILGPLVSCNWIKLAGPGSTTLYCDSTNTTCLGLNKVPNTITLKLKSLADKSQQWTPNNVTLQLTNKDVSSDLCAAAKLVGLLGNPLLTSPLTMQNCASPAQRFTIA